MMGIKEPTGDLQKKIVLLKMMGSHFELTEYKIYYKRTELEERYF